MPRKHTRWRTVTSWSRVAFLGHSNEESSSEVIVQVIIANIVLTMHLFEAGIIGIGQQSNWRDRYNYMTINSNKRSQDKCILEREKTIAFHSSIVHVFIENMSMELGLKGWNELTELHYKEGRES